MPTGWVIGLRGPAFPYFMKITGTNTGNGSMFISSYQFGKMVGSLSGGFMMDKWNKQLILIVGCLMLGISTIAMPWCNMFWVMMIDSYLQGHSEGTVVTGCLTECSRIWEGYKTARTYLQGMVFFVPVGALLSPLVIAEYLKNGENNTTSNNWTNTAELSLTFNKTSEIPTDNIAEYLKNGENNTTCNNWTNTAELSLTFNKTSEIPTDNIYIPFIMAGVICFLNIIPFLIVLCKSSQAKKRPKSSEIRDDAESNVRVTGRLHIVIAMSFIALMMFLANGTENLTTQFLPHFLVTEMKWKNYLSSDIMSVFWGMYALGRFLGIPVSRMLRSYVQLLCGIILVLVCLCLFVVGCHLRNDVLIWISTTGHGLFTATMQPCVLAWALNEVIPATGKNTSFTVVFVALGAMILPLILGNLMEQYSPMYIGYLSLVTCALLIVAYTSFYFFVRLKVQSTHSEIEVDTNSICKDDNELITKVNNKVDL